MDDCTIFIYTHSEYTDILKYSLTRLERYMPDIQYTICTNDKTKLPPDFNYTHVYEYTDSVFFYKKLAQCLEQMTTNYVLFLQDVDVLIDYVDMELLQNSYMYMKRENIDQMRLYCTGVHPIITRERVFDIDKKDMYQMSVRAAAWKRISYLDLCKKFSNKNYREAEGHDVQEYARLSYKNTTIFTLEDTLLSSNMLLYQSKVFPTIRVTMGKKWTVFPFYKTQLQILGEEFQIDFSIRGFYEGRW